jgi:hypothetical protein
MSKCQFDFRPLKIKNRLEIHACRWHATYIWKALDKGYNFALDQLGTRSYGLPKCHESQF